MRMLNMVGACGVVLALAGALAPAAWPQSGTAATNVVGTWHDIESGTIYVFDAEGGYTEILSGDSGAVGRYRADPDAAAGSILLGPGYDVRFSPGDGVVGTLSPLRPGAEPVPRAAGAFVHASGADPLTATLSPFGLVGSWVMQDGSSVMTFAPDGTGSVLVLGRYGEMPLDGPGTRLTFTYSYAPAADGGVIEVAFDHARYDLAFVPWGPDVIQVSGRRHGDVPPDPAVVRTEGGSMAMVRVVDVP